MELTFQSTPLPYLRTLSRQKHTAEQTQEVRLNDGMSDIGLILGVWGQVLLRSKQWNSDSFGINAGVMAQILYQPEDGGAPAAVEVWIPFQQRFDLPETQGREGRIFCSFDLAGVDARSVSARKMIVRVNVDTLAEAMLPEQALVYTPGDVPEDVQLLKNTYPVLLPVEAGEKPFELEEILTVPAGSVKPVKIISYRVFPRTAEKKLLTDKVIFRGSAGVHLVYLGEDDQVYHWDAEVPFSQYGELEQEYESDACAFLTLIPTSMEVDADENGQWKLQLGLVGQYKICQRELLTLTEDAYSPHREVEMETEPLYLPIILDQQEQRISAAQSVNGEGIRLADISFWPRIAPGSEPGSMELSGHFQTLYYDLEGNLRSVASRWEQPWSIPAGEDTQIQVQLFPEQAQGDLSASGADVRADMIMRVQTVSKAGMDMVSALELGQLQPADPDRPSLILRRAGEDDLWTIAKKTGSTVDAIRDANDLQQEPEANRILLIPVS